MLPMPVLYVTLCIVFQSDKGLIAYQEKEEGDLKAIVKSVSLKLTRKTNLALIDDLKVTNSVEGNCDSYDSHENSRSKEHLELRLALHLTMSRCPLLVVSGRAPFFQRRTARWRRDVERPDACQRPAARRSTASRDSERSWCRLLRRGRTLRGRRALGTLGKQPLR
jgi:hypothetical protein